MANSNPIKRIYDLYTSDLSYDEIERLIKREASEVYDFFSSEIPKPDPSVNKFTRVLIFARSLFNAFILKLTPGRRLFYLASLLFFFFGYINDYNSYIVLSFLILNLLLAFELADKLSAKGELEIARKIQSDLIPKDPPQIPNYETAVYYESAREVGGDYFEVIKSTKIENKNYIIIGDISGKGMAAALYMVRVQAIINLLLNDHENVKDVVINLKKYFSKNLRKEYFLTLVAAGVESDGSINLCRAGHNPVLHYKKSSNEIVNLNPQGIGIGFNDKGVFEKTLEVLTVKPESGDILFFYTDGVTETMNIHKQQFGDERLKKIIANNAGQPVETIKKQLLNALNMFKGNEAQYDDLTMVIIKAL